MREYSVPATVTVGDEENLVAAVFDTATSHPSAVSYRRQLTEGEWTDVTAPQFAAEVTAVARGLIAAGVGAGDRVALLSRTRYEWSLIDYAILAAGGVTVPVYETSSAEQVAWILADSGARTIVVETPRHVDVVTEAGTDVEVLVIEPASEESAVGTVAALTARGADVPADEVHARRNAVRADDLATLIYTSGTTGRPKGCELTHRNLLTESRTMISLFPEMFAGEGGSVLQFLPMAHVFGKAIQCAATASRTTAGHTPDVKTLVADLGSFRPTFLVAAPRVFEKVYNSARARAHDGGRGRIFDAAADTAIAWSKGQDGGGAGILLKARHAVFDRLVYSKLRAVVGGRVRVAASGSAPLGDRLGHFFRGIGIPILEGYGLTETAAGITANTIGAIRVGSVGRPLPGHSVRIAEDGEVLLKGPLVFRGYWNNATATAEALADGWFHSGDIGELDDAGFLTITGRKKEIIVTAGGKNVAPAVLEDRLRSHPLISQCLVVGDQQPFIAALVTIDAEALPGWRERHGKPAADGVPTEDPDLLAEVQQAVDDANKAVSRAEQIRRFRVLPVDFTEAGGEMTPTMKVKRQVVAKNFAADITALYA